jgi:hypothetical protein
MSALSAPESIRRAISPALKAGFFRARKKLWENQTAGLDYRNQSVYIEYVRWGNNETLNAKGMTMNASKITAQMINQYRETMEAIFGPLGQSDEFIAADIARGNINIANHKISALLINDLFMPDMSAVEISYRATIARDYLGIPKPVPAHILAYRREHGR